MEGLPSETRMRMLCTEHSSSSVHICTVSAPVTRGTYQGLTPLLFPLLGMPFLALFPSSEARSPGVRFTSGLAFASWEPSGQADAPSSPPPPPIRLPPVPSQLLTVCERSNQKRAASCPLHRVCALRPSPRPEAWPPDRPFHSVRGPSPHRFLAPAHPQFHLLHHQWRLLS